MATKITFYFESGKRGWQEVWYNNVITSPDTTPDNVTITQACTKSIAIRWAPCRITAYRISTVIPPIISRLHRLGTSYVAAGPSGPSAATDGPEVVAVDAFCRWYSVGTYKKGVWVRGLRDTAINRQADSLDTPTAALVSQIQSYWRTMWAYGFVQKRVKRIGEGGTLTYGIQAIRQDPLNVNRTEIELKLVSGWADDPNLRIVFSGINRNDLPAFPQSAFATATGPLPTKKFSIPYRFRGAGDYNPGKAYARNYVADYPVAIEPNYDIFQFFGTRDTGRPFDLFRGRSRAVTRAQ